MRTALRDGTIYILNDTFKHASETLHESTAFNPIDQVYVYGPFRAPASNLHLQDLATGIVFTFTADPSSIISRASSNSSATQTGSHLLQDESDATKQDPAI